MPTLPNVRIPEMIAPDKSSFNDSFQNYLRFIDYWNPNEISKSKQLKAIVIIRNNQFDIIDVPLITERRLNEEISEIDSTYLINQAIQRNATDIVLAENTSFDGLGRISNVEKIVKSFNNQAKEKRVKISDYIVLSKFGYNSYKDNQKKPIIA